MASPKIYASANQLLNNSNSHNDADGHEDGHVDEDEGINPLVQCGLCQDVYDDPRVLPCSHTFCLECLQKQVDAGASISPSSSLTCSLCSRPWAVPEEGLTQLPINTDAEMFVASLPAMGECAMAGDGGEHGRVECVCVDCWEALCDSCSRVHRKTTLTRNHSVRLVADLTQMDIDRHRSQQPLAMCQTHKNQELVLYCDKCAVVVCTVCYAASHSKHGCVELSNADETFIDTIRKSVAEGRAAEKKLQARLQQLDGVLKKIDDQQSVLMDDSMQRAKEIRNKLQSAYDTILTELEKAEIKWSKDATGRIDKERHKLTRSSHSCEEKLKKIHQFVASYEKYLPPHSTAVERASFAKQLRVTMDAIVKETSGHNDLGKSLLSHVTGIEALSCDVTLTSKWREIVPSIAKFNTSFAITQLKSWFSAGILSQQGDRILASCLLAPELHIYGTDGQHRRTINVPAKVKDAAWTTDGRIVCTTNDTNSVVVMTDTGDVIKESQMTSPWCVSVSREGVIYLADYSAGAYQSQDGGLTWQHLFKPPDGWALWQVINVHTDHGDVFWALEEGAGSGGSRRLREYPASLATPTESSSRLGVNGNATSRRGSNISNSDSDKDLDLECSFLWGCSRLAYDGDGSIFFADCKNNVIHLFAANGAQRQRRLLVQGDGINRPRGLAVDRERRLLYVGQSEGDVRVFTLGDGRKTYELRVDF